MKLEVGMYVRTCDGRIAKIEEIEDDIASCDNWLYQTFDAYIDFIHLADEIVDEITKVSFDIMDLIEVGDIIRYRIDKVPLETKGYLIGVTDITDEEMIESIKENKNYHVLQILTKEQFEQMEYKVGE